MDPGELARQRMMAAFDDPAFIRRHRRVEWQWQRLLQSCQSRRERLLEVPRLRLAQLNARSGELNRLSPWLSKETIYELQLLLTAWQPQLRKPVPVAKKRTELKRPLDDLQASFERFNRRWQEFLEQLDLSEINQSRADYNEFYLIEKECALGSAKLAREGFEPLSPVGIEALFECFPLLPQWWGHAD